MQDIDFLPAQYRQQRAQRRMKPWRVIVVALFLMLGGAAAWGQHRAKQAAEAELDAVMTQYDQVVLENNQLASLQTTLKTVGARAELYTYLRHPWPRTQLLAALLAPMPEDITLKQIQITLQRSTAPRHVARETTAEKKQREEQAEKLPPAARDLQRLREQFAETTTQISISGTTGGGVALHRYLGELAESPLFRKVELQSSEILETRQGGEMQFEALVEVEPGHGE